MPLRKPKEGETQTEWMQYCMHEVSQNPDRSNEQNVAICMQAWRDRHKKDMAPREELVQILDGIAEILAKYYDLTPKKDGG